MTLERRFLTVSQIQEQSPICSCHVIICKKYSTFILSGVQGVPCTVQATACTPDERYHLHCTTTFFFGQIIISSSYFLVCNISAKCDFNHNHALFAISLLPFSFGCPSFGMTKSSSRPFMVNKTSKVIS